MKKNKNKFLISLCAFLAFGSLCLGAGCSGCKGCKDPEQEITQAEITLDQNSISLLIGEEASLGVEYEPIDGYTLEFVSSNPEIATVSKDGKIVAVSEGEATITVTYGQRSKSCQVLVGLGGQTPRLLFSQGFEQEVSVLLGEKLDMSAYVLFNTVRYDDVQLTYNVDAEYGSITENIFEAIKVGETEIEVVASWRGVESADFTQTVKVKIQKDLEVYVNDGSLATFTLYASDVTGEDIQIPFVPVITQNGLEQSDVVVSVEDDTVATYANGVLSAVAVGETSVRVSHEELGISKTFPVRVLRPIVKHTGAAVDFSVQDGDLDYASKIGSETLIAAEQEGRALTIDSGKIMGVIPNIVEDGAERKVETTKIILYTPTVGYEYELLAYTKIIKTASDLAVLDLSEVKTIDGYFALGNDIAYDETWLGNANTAVTGSNVSTCRFAGTFDGRGYTLTTNVGKGGLFGNLSGQALIKDVYIQIKKMSANVGFGINGTGNSATNATTFDNVYVSVNLDESSSATPYALFQNCQGFLTLRNTVIDVQYSQDILENRTYGVLWQATTNHTTHVFENSYVITADDSRAMISYYNVKTNAEQGRYVSSHYDVYAENEGETEKTVSISAAEDKNGLAHTKTIKVLTGLRRYTSFGEMQEDKANCKLKGFKNDYWNTSTGIPLWRTAIQADELTLMAGNTEASENVNIPVINDSVDIAVMYRDANVNEMTAVSVKLYGANEAGIVRIDGTTITGLSVGIVTVRVSYKLGGVTYNKDLKVLVGNTTITKTEVVEYFSAKDGVFDLSLLNGASANDVISATQLIDGNEVALGVSVGTNGELIISGVTPNMIAGSQTTYSSTLDEYNNGTLTEETTSKSVTDKTIGATQITIYTKQKTYVFTNVMAYTKVIDEASDWADMQATGYYILKNDIAFASTDSYTEVVFEGTLDGNGKTVSGFTKALFDSLKGTVKNVSLVGTIESAGVFGSDVNTNAFISNVYLSVTLTKNTAYALTSNLRESVWKDVMIEIQNGDAVTTEHVELFASAISTFSKYYKQIVFDNVVVVTKDNDKGVSIHDDAFVDYTNKTGTTKYKVYAGNDDATDFKELSKTTDDTQTTVVSDGYRRIVYTGITRHADKATAGTVIGNWTVASDGSVSWTAQS